MKSRLHYNPPPTHGGQRLPMSGYVKQTRGGGGGMGFEERMPMNYEGRAKGEAVVPPGDSDTDSGICADSEQSSSSPSQLPSTYHPTQHYRPPRPSFPLGPPPVLYKHFDDVDNDRDYLTPNSARRLFEGVAVSSPRRLPARPASANGAGGGGTQPGNGGGTLARNGANGKQFRVRFADQIPPAPPGQSASFTPSLASSPSTSNASPRVAYDGYNGQAAAPTNGKRILPQTRVSAPLENGHAPQYVNYDVANDRLPDNGHGYSVDDVEGLPEPPSYSVALQRLNQNEAPRSRSRLPRDTESAWTSIAPRESLRDSLIRASIEDTIRARQDRAEGLSASGGQYLRNRSSSLPRGRRSEGEIQPLWPHQLSPNGALAASVDNLQLEEAYSNPSFAVGASAYDERAGSLPRRRCLPALPPALNQAPEGYGRRPAYSRGRRCRGVTDMITRRSASVGRYPSVERVQQPEFAPGPPVRAQLIALDHRGFRTVLIEKIQPGPFGFYIATGMVNGQRGIFISRVSIASLSPILSIGDEIVYVDDELVKGRSLEYVQSLITGKTSVTIVLLPTVGPAM